jgi:hypothetical protein
MNLNMDSTGFFSYVQAFIFYFTHPRQTQGNRGTRDFSRSKRSAIQVAELGFDNGQIVVN